MLKKPSNYPGLAQLDLQSRFGTLQIQHDNQRIYQAVFRAVAKVPQRQYTPFEQKIQAELDCYEANPWHRFRLDLNPIGTPFQERVWKALLDIAAGQLETYGGLALRLQTSPRAIGQACKNNPITLFIPCHRVLGKQSLGGYMGKAVRTDLKQALLDHEGPQ